MLEQLPTPEDLGCGYQNKKHLDFWVLQCQILKVLQVRSPWSSHSCTSSTAVSSSWDRTQTSPGATGDTVQVPKV